MNDRNDDELRRERPEPEPELEPTTPEPEIDAAESRWDPWLEALARMEAEEEERAPLVN
jgi:hypothetical protein